MKKFSGKPEDFDEFERSWENHLRMVSATNGGEAVNSFACLQILRTALDPASIAMLDARLTQDPDLEYYEFWKEFTARHRRHSQAIQKKNWEAVKVSQKGPLLTLQEWAEFLYRYRGRRQLVEAWDEDLDRKLVKANLNSYFYTRVKQEACRRREGCRWVRVSLEGAEPVSSLLHELEKQLGVLLPVIKSDRHSATINCPDDQVKTTLVDWDKGTFRGARFRILPVLYEMTGDEILDFVLRTLENDEDFEVDEACNDLKPRSRDRGRPGRGAQQVQASPQEEPAMQGKANQDKQTQDSPSRKKKNKNKNKAPKEDDNYWTTVTHKGKGKGKGKRGHDNGRPQSPPRSQDRRESQDSRGRTYNQAPEPPYPFVSSSGKGGKGKGQGDWCRHCSSHRLPCDHHYLKCQVQRDILIKNLPVAAPQAGSSNPATSSNSQPTSQGAQGSPRRSG